MDISLICMSSYKISSLKLGFVCIFLHNPFIVVSLKMNGFFFHSYSIIKGIDVPLEAYQSFHQQQNPFCENYSFHGSKQAVRKVVLL